MRLLSNRSRIGLRRWSAGILSGWPIVTHANFPDELAYHFVAALEKIRGEIPYDAAVVPPMSSFCRSTEAGPLDIPLHPGAERYYREHGYL